MDEQSTVTETLKFRRELRLTFIPTRVQEEDECPRRKYIILMPIGLHSAPTTRSVWNGVHY